MFLLDNWPLIWGKFSMFLLHYSAFSGMVLLYCPGSNDYTHIGDSEISISSPDLFSELQVSIHLGPPPPTSRPSAWSYCYFPIVLYLLYFGFPLIKLQSTQSFRTQELSQLPALSHPPLLPPYPGNDQGLSIWSPSGC